MKRLQRRRFKLPPLIVNLLKSVIRDARIRILHQKKVQAEERTNLNPCAQALKLMLASLLKTKLTKVPAFLPLVFFVLKGDGFVFP